MADGRFDAFVVFAGMRTGSNYLEASLDTLADVTCHGEIFNPTFIGQHNRFELFGFDMDRREADPEGLIAAMIAQSEGRPGFRLFHDHDARAIARVLHDPRIAKVILTRNPLDSYVSRKIAAETGQWRLSDMKHRRDAQITFDAAEFAAHLGAIETFQAELRIGLQTTGQTAFEIRYDDLGRADILSGLARFLGSEHEMSGPANTIKKQNPSTLREKVSNFDAMIVALGQMDPFGVQAQPSFEPARAPGAKGFHAHPEAGLLFLPIRGAPVEPVLDWMGQIGDVGREGLLTGQTQQEVRAWMKAHPGFRAFSVLRHPLERAYAVFTSLIVPTDRPDFATVRKVLRNRYKVPLPAKGSGTVLDVAAQRAAFLAYLQFVKGNLSGQTSLRVDPAWASQTALLQGMTRMVLPHRLIPEAELEGELQTLAHLAGVTPTAWVPEADAGAIALKDIYDGKIEQAAIAAYRPDYINFGFSRWNQR